MLFEGIAWERNDRFDISHKLSVAYNIVYIYIFRVINFLTNPILFKKANDDRLILNLFDQLHTAP